MPFTVRALDDDDRRQIAASLVQNWGSCRIVSRGRLTEDASLLSGFLATGQDGTLAGYVLLRGALEETEVVVLHSLVPSSGVGTGPVAGGAPAHRGARRSADLADHDQRQSRGYSFCQRRGWDWVAFHRNALVRSRRLKPEIPEIGRYGIPLRHEVEPEIRLPD